MNPKEYSKYKRKLKRAAARQNDAEVALIKQRAQVKTEIKEGLDIVSIMAQQNSLLINTIARELKKASSKSKRETRATEKGATNHRASTKMHSRPQSGVKAYPTRVSAFNMKAVVYSEPRCAVVN